METKITVETADGKSLKGDGQDLMNLCENDWLSHKPAAQGQHDGLECLQAPVSRNLEFPTACQASTAH